MPILAETLVQPPLGNVRGYIILRRNNFDVYNVGTWTISNVFPLVPSTMFIKIRIQLAEGIGSVTHQSILGGSLGAYGIDSIDEGNSAVMTARSVETRLLEPKLVRGRTRLVRLSATCKLFLPISKLSSMTIQLWNPPSLLE